MLGHKTSKQFADVLGATNPHTKQPSLSMALPDKSAWKETASVILRQSLAALAAWRACCNSVG